MNYYTGGFDSVRRGTPLETGVSLTEFTDGINIDDVYARDG